MSEYTERLASSLLRASLSQFEADRQKALTTLDLYLHGSVGIGDHPTVVEEVITATKNLSEAEEAISCLQRNFFPNQEELTEDAE